jgi:hypothetical protein
MSVIITIRVSGDPKRLEEYAAAHRDTMAAILERAKANGLIAHRFYGSDDGEIMVADEWPDPQSFRSFFEENRPQIAPIFAAAGATSEPEVKFWRKLETHDEVGWQ